MGGVVRGVVGAVLDGTADGIENGWFDMLGSCDKSELGVELRAELGTMLGMLLVDGPPEACKEG